MLLSNPYILFSFNRKKQTLNSKHKETSEPTPKRYKLQLGSKSHCCFGKKKKRTYLVYRIDKNGERILLRCERRGANVANWGERERERESSIEDHHLLPCYVYV